MSADARHITSAAEIKDADVALFKNTHEGMAKKRVVALQKELDSLPDNDKDAFEALRNRLELQLKIEELMVKSRESEHANFKLYARLFLPTLTTIGGGILGWFLNSWLTAH